jgi:hypothetical protein
MRNVFRDPRRDDPAGYDQDPRPYYGESDYPPPQDHGDPLDPYEEGPLPEGEADVEQGRGCSWILIFILMLAVGSVVLVSWGVTRVVLSGMVQPMREMYKTVSLMPARGVKSPQAEMQLQIYYMAGGRTLVPETRRLRKPASENERLRLIAQELRQPPTGKLLENPLPPGTEIHGVYLAGGIAYVDMNVEFTKVERPTPLRERLAIYALVNSLMLNNRSIQGVQILIDGHPAPTAWGWLDISGPLGPDLSLSRVPEAPGAAG